MALGAELDGPIKYEIHGKVGYLYPTTFIYDSARLCFPCNICHDIIFIFYAGCSLTMHRRTRARSLRASLKNPLYSARDEKSF
jgi:hypothetical protein